MDVYHLSFCDIQIINPHVAIFIVFPSISSLSKKHLEELDVFLENEMIPPYALISDSREVHFSLTFDAIYHARTNPVPTVVASISNDISLAENSLTVLKGSSLEHKAFTDPESAIAWVNQKLGIS